MLSEADLVAKRATLRWLAKPHPEWTHQDLVRARQLDEPLHRWVVWADEAE